MGETLGYVGRSLGHLITNLPLVTVAGLLSVVFLGRAFQKVSNNDRNYTSYFFVLGGLFGAFTVFLLWKQNVTGRQVRWSDLTASSAVVSAALRSG